VLPSHVPRHRSVHSKAQRTLGREKPAACVRGKQGSASTGPREARLIGRRCDTCAKWRPPL
jgi:hypothetical protein